MKKPKLLSKNQLRVQFPTVMPTNICIDVALAAGHNDRQRRLLSFMELTDRQSTKIELSVFILFNAKQFCAKGLCQYLQQKR